MEHDLRDITDPLGVVFICWRNLGFHCFPTVPNFIFRLKKALEREIANTECIVSTDHARKSGVFLFVLRVLVFMRQLWLAVIPCMITGISTASLCLVFNFLRLPGNMSI